LNPVISVAQVQPWDDLVLTGPPVQPPRATHLFQTLTRSKLSHKPIPPRLAISDLIPAIEVAVSRFAEVTELEREVADLSDRLETRKLVERAKGLLQTKQGMTEPEAFKWIQRAAMDRRTTMRRVAEVVLETFDTDAPR